MALLNGRLPASLLATIPGTGQRIRADLVPQTAALRSAFQARFGKSLVVTDGYRDYDAQVRVKAQKGWLAATPGMSNHGLGQAIDFGSGVQSFSTAEYAWMKANAPRFGWTHPAWAEPRGSKPEPWHWEATVVPVSNYRHIPGAVADAPELAPPAPLIPLEVDDMKVIRDEQNGSIALIGEAYVGEFGGADQGGIAAATAVFGDWKNLNHQDYVTAVQRATGRMAAARAGMTAADVAAQVVPSVTAAITALPAATGVDQAAVEKALRNVLGSLG